MLHTVCICIQELLYVTLFVFASVGAAVIQGPSEVIYRPNEGQIELTCTVTNGLVGWRINDGVILTIPEIRAQGRLPDHTVNGTNLVVVNATNNTEYVCVSLQILLTRPVLQFISI